MSRSWLLIVLLGGCWPRIPGSWTEYGDIPGDTGLDPDTDPDTDPGTDPDTDPGTDPDTDPGTDPDTDPDTTGGPLVTTISDIQTGAVPPGTLVRVEDVVATTDQHASGFFIQDDAGAYNGIFVSAPDLPFGWIDLGDELNIEGTVAERPVGSTTRTEIQVSRSAQVMRLNTTRDPITMAVTFNDVRDGGANSIVEPWESVLVTLVDGTVVTEPSGSGEWLLEGPFGTRVRVGQMFYDTRYVQTGGTFDALIGVMHRTGNSLALQPRWANDAIGYEDPVSPGDVTISDIQTGAVAVGDVVTLTDVTVTTPQNSDGFYVQDGGGPYNGLYVYAPSLPFGTVSTGDRVTLTGEVDEYTTSSSSFTELVVSDATDVQTLGTSRTPVVTNIGHRDLSEQWEGQLVRLGASTVINTPDFFGEWSVISESDGGLVILDDEFTLPSEVAPLGTFTNLVGVVHDSWGDLKLEPRSQSDFVGYTSPDGCPAFLCVEDLTVGDLAITEIFYNPTSSFADDAGNEWIEIVNLAGLSVNLHGLEIYDGESSAFVVSRASIPNGGRVVLAQQHTSPWVWSFSPDGWYVGDIQINNGGGEEISLYANGVLLDTSPGTPSRSGRSWQLGRGFAVEPFSFEGDWCSTPTSTAPIAGTTTEYGTPGAMNVTCP